MLPTSLASSSSLQTVHDVNNVLTSSLASSHPIPELLHVEPGQENGGLLHTMAGGGVSLSAATSGAETGVELVSQLTDLGSVSHTQFSSVLLQPTGPLMTSAQKRLNNLFEDEKEKTEKLSDEHWKYPEYPLARIKKIMRMDEDVKMISGEVPILFSKAIELFVTELTLRAWIYTEETKRRTVQRSDLAMAIAKNDMFDFLIDIVPREEIHSRTKTIKDVPSETPTTTPQINSDLIQSYLQLLTQQTEAATSESGDGAKGEAEGGGLVSDPALASLAATSTLMQQQVQLLQQLAQIQQQQQTQEQQLPPQVPVTSLPQQPTNSVSDIQTSHFTELNVPSSMETTASHSMAPSDSNLLGLTTHPDHYQPHGEPGADFVTLLTSNQVDQLPTSQPLTSSSHLSELTHLNGEGVQRLIIHPGGVVTQPFTTLEEHPTVTTGESLFPDHSSGLQVGSSTDEFTTDHFVTGSSLGPTALVFTDSTSDMHT